MSPIKHRHHQKCILWRIFLLKNASHLTILLLFSFSLHNCRIVDGGSRKHQNSPRDRESDKNASKQESGLESASLTDGISFSTLNIGSSVQTSLIQWLAHTHPDWEECVFLISVSGWADRGQIAIVRSKENYFAYFVEPTLRSFGEAKPLELGQKAQEAFFTIVDQASSLREFNSSVVDGVQYGYGHWLQTSGKAPKENKAFSMNNPADADSGSEPHAALVKVFQDLVNL